MKANTTTGSCTLCHDSEVSVKRLDLYTIGSEGTLVCHTCELELVQFAQALMRANGDKRLAAFKAKRLKENNG